LLEPYELVVTDQIGVGDQEIRAAGWLTSMVARSAAVTGDTVAASQ
jgi:hypothetical protein